MDARVCTCCPPLLPTVWLVVKAWVTMALACYADPALIPSSLNLQCNLFFVLIPGPGFGLQR
ncbi:hypothetical protein ACQUQP_02785 [Marinobacterium sp. YM272]|uniref:hypothetical protein n=1 Tax=Marinobacterium sp. YM272 TaxID=3421654 RepID=UPI003D7F985A